MNAFDECCGKVLELACVLKDDVDLLVRKGDPLSTDWLIETEASIAAAVRRAVKTQGKEQLAALDAAIASWTEAADIEVFLASVGESVQAIGPAIEPTLTADFAVRAVQIIRRTKDATVKTFDFVPSAAKLGSRDEAAAQFVANFQGFWVKNTAGKVSRTLTERARKIIADGVQKGWGTKEIRDALNEKVAGFAKRAGYADAVANSFAARARTYAAVATYQDAGVDLYQIMAVLDERTTDICFAPWTSVAVPGGHKKIVDVRPGDLVITSDGVGVVEAASVRMAVDWVVIELENGRTITATANHPMWTERDGWTRAEEVRVNDVMRSVRGAGLLPPEPAEEVLRPRLLPRDAEGRSVGGSNLPWVRECVSGAVHEGDARRRPVLLERLPAPGEAQGPDGRSHDANLRDVRQSVQGKAHGGPDGEGQEALFEGVLQAPREVRVRGVRSRGMEKGEPEDSALLLEGVLQEVAPGDRSGDGRGGDSHGPRPEFHPGGGRGRSSSGLRLAEPAPGPGGGRNLLARGEVREGRREGLGRRSGRVDRREDESGLLDGGPCAHRGPRDSWGVRVVHVSRLRVALPAHNLQVSPDPTFHVEGVLAHNCRDLDGRIFSVSRAMGKFDQAMGGALGSAANVLPFASERKAEDGTKQIVVDQDGTTHVIADVVESAVGQRDAIGTYNDRLANSDLEALGLSLPPFHNLCRTTVVPYIV